MNYCNQEQQRTRMNSLFEKYKNLEIQEKKGNITWNHPTYNDLWKEEQEEDSFIVNGFEVEEGILECNKCGSKKVLSYSKQVRRADEGVTVYSKCINCKTQWVVNS